MSHAEPVHCSKSYRGPCDVTNQRIVRTYLHQNYSFGMLWALQESWRWLD